MQNHRILVVGKGHVGTYLAQKLECELITHWKDRMEDITEAVIEDLKPSVVINAAGKTDLTWCETYPTEAWHHNVVAPLELFEKWKRAVPTTDDSIFFHLSSGCVWDGPYQKNGFPFSPSDPETPACFYAWTKAACDSFLLRRASGRRLGILRPRQIISPINDKRNTLVKLIGYESLVDDPNSVTSVQTILSTISTLSFPWIHDLNGGRVFNVYDSGIITPYRIGVMLFEHGLRSSLPSNLSKNELDSWHKPKRVNTVLTDPLFEVLVHPEQVSRMVKLNIIGLKSVTH